VGLNLGGLPGGASPDLSLAEVKPEEVAHVEFGVKTNPTASSTLNFAVFKTEIDDYQTLVQDPDPALNRGYLANAKGIAVQGLEVDASLSLDNINLTASYSFTEGEYTSFVNAPVPLELTGLAGGRVDASGGRLPGISKHALSLGGEYSNEFTVGARSLEFFAGIDGLYRSDFSSSPTPSAFLNIDSYSVVNARIGVRKDGEWSTFLWSRNALDEKYFEQLLPGSSGAGYYVGVLGDPRTVGVTLRYEF
jgi:iron complex outermembrane recepter protein